MQPSEPNEAWQQVRLWVLLPGKTPTVFPMTCTITPSTWSWRVKQLVYSVEFSALIPLKPIAQFQDSIRLTDWDQIERVQSALSYADQLSALRTAGIAVPFPKDLNTIPILRYDTNPSPLPGDTRYTGPKPVLLTPIKP